MRAKVYQKAGEARLYRVHSNGKVETSTNGNSWYRIKSLNPSIINQWRRLGQVVKLANRQDVGPSRDELAEELARLRDCLMYGEWEHLSQLIPLDLSGSMAYERTGMQTVKVCITIARGYDAWTAPDGLKRINSGLSIPCMKMQTRRKALNNRINFLEERVSLV